MLFILFLFLGIAYSRLSCAWLDARDRGSRWAAVLIDMGMDTLAWLPVWFALTTEDWTIAIASIIGSGLGTAWGVGRG